MIRERRTRRLPISVDDGISSVDLIAVEITGDMLGTQTIGDQRILGTTS
jgi:hypothetical protein